MTRVSVISIHSNNYGNRLQAYALHQVLHRELDPSGDTRIESLQIPNVAKKRPLWRRAAGKAKRMLKKALGANRTSASANNRGPLFESFTDRYIPTIHIAHAAAAAERDGIFVIGSDQCWNPSWDVGARPDGVQCATGVAAARKLSYAASFGITYDDLPPEWRARYAAWLAEFAPGTISVREDAGAACVRELCGVEAQVVIDPTMLLAPNDWTAIECRPHIEGIDAPFCLKYVLGDDVNSEVISQLCTERGLTVIDLRNAALPVGPAEFVWLIHHSALVCTDSFHASVFSILFERPFVIYERQQSRQCDMSSRFDTLARMLGIEDHRANSSAFNWNAVWNCDWTALEQRLEAERAASLAWLRAALAATDAVAPPHHVDLDRACCGCGAPICKGQRAHPAPEGMHF